MTTLNKHAAEVITETPDDMACSSMSVHGLTDVTGFGLIGHAREMARGSNVSLQIHAAQVPLLPGALECVRAGHVPGGLKANRDFAECVVAWDEDVPEELKLFSSIRKLRAVC